MSSHSAAPEAEFWLFGYGSLIWKPPPHFGETAEPQRTETCYSFQDHRGTPEAPGRVVTLIERSFWQTLEDPHPSVSEKVWGVAYRIEAAKVAEVREYLDIREINGYTIHYTPFHPSDGSAEIRTLVYIGTPDNDQFMGPQDPQKLAEHIHKSVGPSGLNKDYLLQLDLALDGLSKESGDEHVKDLADRVRKLELGPDGDGTQAIIKAVDREVKKASSTDEQEENETGQIRGR
ncbi:hypothetical protein VTL71DRAFT_4129 [Oculimacula yallundae]|uniref:glutathione-specific gamma-glutamylcyclotransferase n=1 Tax=Oculimacula yallundae TaxID=86028 RepID=A0ABR4C4X8_9HELO